jgi:hypothetical protein
MSGFIIREVFITVWIVLVYMHCNIMTYSISCVCVCVCVSSENLRIYRM